MSGELGELEVALYRLLAVRPVTDLHAAAAALSVPVDQLDKPAAILVQSGLAVTEDGEHYTAVSPLLAEVTELGAEELELSARRAAIEARRIAIRQVLPDWIEARRANPAESPIDIVSEPNAIGNVLMHFAEQCRTELLSIAPGRGPGRMDPRTRMANHYSLAQGVKTRAVYQHVALRDRATRAYLRDLADHGARIRLANAVPGRSLVVDREVALIPIPSEDPTQPGGMAIIHEPNVVAWMVATFEQLWAESSPLDELLGAQHAEETDLDHTRATILRLMADGEKDEAISRRLSISVRTCRRHIADYMAQVGASSRFQAGVIAARNGHLDAAPL